MMSHIRQARGRRRRRGSRGGNALIETSLALIVLLWVAMGMVEFGQFLYMKQAFNAAARDGARVASINTGTQAKVVAAVTAGLQQANVAYNASWLTITDLTTGTAVTDITSVTSGDSLRVTVSVNYDQIPNVVRPLYTMTATRFGIKNGKPITGTCTMLKE